MSEPSLDSVDAEGRLRLAWRIAPACMDFILNIEQASRNTESIVDGLLFAAIQSANVSPISRDPALQVAYAMIGDAPPDDLRRPVSVNAVAQSLRMPFETARRRVQGLVRMGAVEVTPRGVLVAKSALGDMRFLTNAILRHEHLKTFYLDMKAQGLAPAPASGALPTWPTPPLRLTNRLIWEYMLRVADDLGAISGDATRGVILLAMTQENTRGFRHDQLTAWTRDPLGLGQPVRNRKLAERLKLSSETMRRYMIALEELGFCLRGPAGLLAVTTPSVRATLDKLVLDNLANVQRLFVRLRQFGVLADWDSDSAAAVA